MTEPIDISTFTLCIVGVRYRLKGGDLKRWLGGIVGKEITIMRDGENTYDPFAVGAWSWVDNDPMLVGYVRSDDRQLAYRLLLACGDDRLQLKVIRTLGDQGTLIAGISGITPAPKEAVRLAPQWNEWVTMVESMTLPRCFEKEKFVAGEVDSLLRKGMVADKELLRQRLEAYIKYSDFDISLETRQKREEIKKALRERDDADDWRDIRGELRRQCGLVGNESSGGGVWSIWMDFIRHPNFSSSFKNGKMPSRSEVEQSLYSFPLDMWTTWITDPNKFVARLYYACVPRKVLWKFISTIAFYNLLTSTTAPNIVLTPWGKQSKQMPDNVLGGLYNGMEWLKDHGNDIPASVLGMMSDEIKERIDARQQQKEESGKQIVNITHLDSFVNTNDGKVINNGRQQ